MICAAFDGTNLWVLTGNPSEQTVVLKKLSKSGDEEQKIPVDFPLAEGNAGVGQMSVTPEGVCVYFARRACFFSREAMDHWKSNP